MNFATCRNCNHCKYRGDKGYETYCELDDKGYVENNKTCPVGKVNLDKYGNKEDL